MGGTADGCSNVSFVAAAAAAFAIECVSQLNCVSPAQRPLVGLSLLLEDALTWQEEVAKTWARGKN